MALQLFEQKIQVPRGDFSHVGQMKPMSLRQFRKNRELLLVWFGVVAVNRWQPVLLEKVGDCRIRISASARRFSVRSLSFRWRSDGTSFPSRTSCTWL